MHKKFKKSAFSLIELSIVILIISVLAAGIISVSTVALSNAKVKVTKERIRAINDAIGAFVARNYRLPCPASLTIAKSTISYGSEAGSGDCLNQGNGIYASNSVPSVVYGMVPVFALGLSDETAEDGFGTKISYVVNANYTIADYPNNIGGGFSFHANNSPDAIFIYQLPSGNLIGNNVYALISHGSNKYGGFNAFSSSRNSLVSADQFEIHNSVDNIVNNADPIIDSATFGNAPANPGFVSITISNPDSEIFDDIVSFRSRDQIVKENNIGFLMPCTESTLGHEAGYNNAFAGEVRYRNSACPFPNDAITPSKECGPFGSVWINRINCP